MDSKASTTETKTIDAKSKTKKEKSKSDFLKRLKRIFTFKRIISLVVVCAILFGTWYFFWGSNTNEEASGQSYVEYTVARGNITESIKQSGVIEPFERYEITSRVMGEIIDSPFEEGDFVEEGQTLYRIDDEDAQLNIDKAENNITKAEHNLEKADNTIEKAENNITKAQNNVTKAQKALDDANKEIAKLNVYASADGKLIDFNIKKNDTVNASVVGKVENTEIRTINIPFFAEDISDIAVGDLVTLTSALYMESMPGIVSHKFETGDSGVTGGSVQKYIEVEIKNPKALDEKTTFSAVVHTKRGDVASAASGMVNAGDTTAIKAETNGTVSEIAVKNGDYVKKGQLIMKLTNESLMNTKENCERALTESILSLNEAKMSLEESSLSISDSQISLADGELNKKSTEKALEDYNITAPISGTVITKNSKVGDNINNSSGQTVMMVIADMSKMKFTINVDELDVDKIQIGQTAVVDADAFPQERFAATVTSIAGEGTSTGNGVTTFTVELTIDNPGNLKSGMNVNANILISQAKDVLVIPEDALSGVRGNRASVLVKSSGNSNEDKANEPEEQKNVNSEIEGKFPKTPSGTMSGGFSGNPDIKPGTVPSGFQNGSQETKGDFKPAEEKSTSPSGNVPSTLADANTNIPSPKKNPNIPEGFEFRTVEIGISDGRNIEIVSGLSEGDIIAYIPTTVTSQNRMMMPMMGGGMPMGGGMMGGGMSAGGGMSGNRGGTNFGR